jgi:hypothetical protein
MTCDVIYTPRDSEVETMPMADTSVSESGKQTLAIFVRTDSHVCNWSWLMRHND